MWMVVGMVGMVGVGVSGCYCGQVAFIYFPVFEGCVNFVLLAYRRTQMPQGFFVPLGSQIVKSLVSVVRNFGSTRHIQSLILGLMLTTEGYQPPEFKREYLNEVKTPRLVFLLFLGICIFLSFTHFHSLIFHTLSFTFFF